LINIIYKSVKKISHIVRARTSLRMTLGTKKRAHLTAEFPWRLPSNREMWVGSTKLGKEDWSTSKP
jgi:hypothetical protein